MQSFQILRTLIDISDKIKILFTEFKYLFLFPRYLFSKLAKSDLILSLRRNNREIKFAPWTLVVTSFKEHVLFTKAKLYYTDIYIAVQSLCGKLNCKLKVKLLQNKKCRTGV